MHSSTKVILALAVSASGAALAAAQAADMATARSVKPAAMVDVPGGDIFGFTSGTDVGKLGDRGIALESSGAFGSRKGQYRGLSQKLELSGTLVENWSFAGSMFGSWTDLRNSPIFADRTSYGFDGASFEVRRRVLERSATNRFAVTLAIEPRWARIDGFSGMQSPAFAAETKFQIDAPVVNGLYWAANLNYAAGRARDPLDLTWSKSSATSASTALTYEALKDEFFIGVEARYQQAWSSAFFGHLNGQAVFLGPTFAWKMDDNIMLNAVLLPQIAGKARGAASPLDLDNFNRANYRVKMAVGF
ncbi:MAG: hypothetical protein JWO64_317 [Hyphomicrobiales bacterium]|jgi:hypothetical protein|nr:hypothetical protein [Hyphomicrobiales bacterium]